MTDGARYLREPQAP